MSRAVFLQGGGPSLFRLWPQQPERADEAGRFDDVSL